VEDEDVRKLLTDAGLPADQDTVDLVVNCAADIRMGREDDEAILVRFAKFWRMRGVKIAAGVAASALAVLIGACSSETGPTCDTLVCPPGCIANTYYSLSGSHCDCDPIDPAHLPPGGCPSGPGHRVSP
jgi:hypothetical protein